MFFGTVNPMRLRVLAFGLILLSLLFYFLGVQREPRFSVGSTSESNVVGVISGLQLCLPMLEREESDCLYQHMPRLALLYGPNAVLEGVWRIGEEYPAVRFNCHTPGHEMGRVVYNELGSLRKALTGADDRCMGSYIHGVFDAWSATPKEHDDFVMAAKLCNGYSQGSTNLCYDGLAHSLWSKLGSADEVSQVCGVADKSEGRYGCLAGVLMQMYSPVIGEASNKLVNFGSELPRFCNSLSEWSVLDSTTGGFGSYNNPSIKLACVNGSLTVLKDLYLDKVLSKVKPGSITPRVESAIEEYLQGCKSLSHLAGLELESFLSECESVVGGYLYLYAPIENSEISREACNRWFSNSRKSLQACLGYIESLKERS